MKYKYSIVIPAHNRSGNIQEIIDKFLNIRNCEIIIVENGSTEKEIKEYKKIEIKNLNKSNVKFIYLKAGSLASARKYGSQTSMGEGLFFCDDDDFPTNNFIKMLNTQVLSKNTIYTFKLKCGKFDYHYPPKKLNMNSLNKTMQPSTYIVQSKYVVAAYKKINRKGMMISIGEDQLLSKMLYEIFIKNNMKLRYTRISSVIFPYFPGTSMTGGVRDFNNDSRILEGFLEQEGSEANDILFYKIIKQFSVNAKNKKGENPDGAFLEINKLKLLGSKKKS